jgi:hypothetical protein
MRCEKSSFLNTQPYVLGVRIASCDASTKGYSGNTFSPNLSSVTQEYRVKFIHGVSSMEWYHKSTRPRC